MISKYELYGSLFGAIGAYLISTNSHLSAYGYMFCLVSNAFFVAFSIKNKYSYFLILQFFYAYTSINGIQNTNGLGMSSNLYAYIQHIFA